MFDAAVNALTAPLTLSRNCTNQRQSNGTKTRKVNVIDSDDDSVIVVDSDSDSHSDVDELAADNPREEPSALFNLLIVPCLQPNVQCQLIACQLIAT